MLDYHIMITNDIWYKTLKKSNLTPPNYVFKYVWTILYIMMFFSLIKYIKPKTNKLGLIFFSIQLFFNLIWTPIFFKYKDTKKALYILIALLISLFITFNIFYRENKKA